MPLPTTLDTTNTGVIQDAAELLIEEDDTPTDVGSTYALASGATAHVTVEAICFKSDGTIAKVWHERIAVVKNSGGTVTATTQESLLDPAPIGSFSGGAVTLATASGNLKTTVTNPDDTNDYRWRVTRQITVVQNSAFGGGAVFDPATLSPSFWLRAGYTGSPWGSVDANGGRTASGATPPAQTTLGGKNIARFDGADDKLDTNALESALFTASAGAIAILYRAESLASAAGAIYNDPALFCGLGGYVHVAINSTGPRIGLYDTGYKQVQLTGGTSGWHMVMMRWNGTALEACLDGGTWENAGGTVGNMGDLTNYCRIGANLNNDVFFDGDIAEVLCKAGAWADGDRANLKSYFNAEYGLSL